MATCLVCNDGRSCELYHCPKHEQSASHQSILKYRAEQTPFQSSEPHPPVPSETDLPEDALQNLLASLAGPSTHPYPTAVHRGYSPPHHAGINWNLFEANKHTDLQDQSPEQ